MELVLNEQQALLADTAARLARDAGGPKRMRDVKARGTGIDRDAWRAVVEAGWLTTAVEEHHEGLGLGLFDCALCVEQAGRNLLMVPVAEAMAALWAMSAADAAAPVRAALSGARLVLPAIDAPFWHFAAAPAQSLRFDPRSHSVTGTVPGVPHAPAADMLLVAPVSSEPMLCLVGRSNPSVTVEAQQTVDGSVCGTVRCEHARIERVIARGETAQWLVEVMREILALLTAVELIGLADAALALTLDYVKLRHQFGRPIGSFQVLQHRGVDAFIDNELNRSLAYRVLTAFDSGHCEPAMISAIKARASRSALQTVRAALQMHGANGYTEEHDIGLCYKRAIALAARYGGELQHNACFSALTFPAAPMATQETTR